ncbi:TetR/AcrR family transcriptional regulator [Lolliginicoccus levis]|uniref:TetR/AcrR family transcriptional regulator n=1 Tax=Lolliginicoccus levis TaxID=2919542 RepID=UPI00241C2835|nr:TetR/AcrR family transcriptional regulator [Lolliginicoccus levis]
MTSGTDPAPRKRRRYAPRMPVEQRREQLLDAALRVVVRDGYDNVSIEAIAKEAGVTRPVVYSAYDGLEPLLHALLDRTQRRALAAALKLIPTEPRTGDVDEWFLDGVAGLIDLVREQPEIWKPVLGITTNTPAMVRDRIESTRELIRGYIADALRLGIEQRGGPWLDVEVLSHLVLVTSEHFGRLMLEDPPRYTRDRLVDTLRGLLDATRPPA